MGIDPGAGLDVGFVTDKAMVRADTYRVTNTNDNGPGSLRQAIIDANGMDGPDTIEFDIDTDDPDVNCDDDGVCTIELESALPDMDNDDTTIDGYTQDSAQEATDTEPAQLKIQIDGTNAGLSNGITIASNGNTVKGLVINRFRRWGVSIKGDNNQLPGCHIGTDVDGTADLGNGTAIGGGVIITGTENRIGGPNASERCVISGNTGPGIRISGAGTEGNWVEGNYIGTDASGTEKLGNSSEGVIITGGAEFNFVKPVNEHAPKNVIGGNDGPAVRISGNGTEGNTVTGNYLGTNAAGDDLGNGEDGIRIGSEAKYNWTGEKTDDRDNDWKELFIWGAQKTDWSNNVIAYNGGHGVMVDGNGTISNTITRNSIFSNSMGIVLTNGANGGITAPVIVTTTEAVNIVGVACANCTVEVFENSDIDGEGETYVGDTTADTNGVFTVTVSSLNNPYLTATATDAISGTSEFSAVFTATVTGGYNIYVPIIYK